MTAVAVPAAPAAAATGGSLPTSEPLTSSSTSQAPGSRVAISASDVPADGSDGGAADGELVGLRTERSRTYRTAQGLQARVWPVPVNVRNAAGGWDAVDTTLVPDETATGKDRVRTRRGWVSAQLPDSLDEPVRVAGAGGTVEFTLQGADPAAVRSTSGDVALYREVLPGVDVRYEALNTGLKEDLLLAGSSGPSSFTWTLSSVPGGTFDLDAGQILVRDAQQRVRLVIPPPTVQDAAGAFSSSAVRYRLTDTADTASANRAELSVEVDRAWLTDPARAFPVAVDPNTQGVSPGQSVYLSQGAPTTNFNGASTLKVGQGPTGEFRSLIKYDLAAALPRHVDVISTELKGTVVGNSVPGSTVVTARALSRPWSTAATWGTSNGTGAWTTAGGDVTGPSASSEPVTSSSPSLSAMVTPLVQGWAKDPASNHGLLLSAAGSGTVLDLQAGADTPYLSVNYTTRSGDRPFYSTLDVPLSDRSGLKVNLASGNLQVQNNDVQIAGNGGDLTVGRFYDSQGTSRIFSSPLPGTWTQSPGKDLKLLSYDDGQLLLGVAGSQAWFAENGSGGYTTPPGLAADLTAAGSNYPAGYLALRYRSSGQTLIFGYFGLLVEIKDRNNNKVTLAYSSPLSAASRVTTMTDTRGRTLTFGYTPGELLSQITDSIGRTWKYGYDSTGTYLTSYTDPNSAKTTYGYNSQGLLSQIVDWDGRVTNLTYDAQRRAKTIMRVTGTSNGIDTGPTTTFTYTDTPVSYTDSTGTGFAYPGKTVVTDANGRTTTHFYDSESRVTRTVDALGRTRSRGYTANSDVNSAVDALGTGSSAGNATLSTFDTDNRATGSTLPTGAASTLAYAEPAGPVTSQVAHWQPNTASDPDGSRAAFTYDTAGNLTKAQDTTPGPGGTPTAGAAVTYAVFGNPGVASCGGRSSQTGQVCSATDGRGKTTSYAYNSLGELVTVTPPAPLGTTQYTYDGASRVAVVTDGKGQVTRYSYDNLDRVSTIRYGTTTCTSTDIAAGNCIDYDTDSAGNPVLLVDNTGTTTYGYDKLSRETSRTQPNGSGGTLTTTLTYDGVGNVLTSTDPTGTTTYSYDAANQLKDLAEPGGSCTSSPAVRCTTFGYNNNGARTSTTYPTSPATVLTSTLDNSGRPTRMTAVTGTPGSGGTTHVDLAYTYNYTATGGAAGAADGTLVRTRTDQSATGSTGRTTTYGYDSLARLISAVETSSAGATTASWSYGYDMAGNRTSASLTGVPGAAATTFTYNDANQIVTRNGITGYGYDANGNETSALTGTSTSGTGRTSTWNKRNQLTSLTPAGGSAIGFGYRGASQDTRLTAGPTSYRNTALGLTAQNNGSIATTGSTTSTWIRTPDGTLVAQRTGTAAAGTSHYYLFDNLGSVLGLLNSTGARVNSYSYDPYGISRTKTETVANPWQYTGGYLDGATGLYKFGIRYYDPALGRFTQLDPTGQDPHYTYAGNSPISFTDPTGASLIGDILKGAAGILVGAAVGGIVAGAVSAILPAAAPVAGYIGACIGGAIGSSVAAGDISLGNAVSGCVLGGVGRLASKLRISEDDIAALTRRIIARLTD